MGDRWQGLEGGKTIGGRQRGFTLIELAIATLVLLVGVVAVIQLVPSAMRLNLWNRYDSTSTVVAQRLLDEMLSQPLAATNFTNSDGQVMQLGGAAPPTPPGYYGGPLIPVTARIDFTNPNSAVAGYSYPLPPGYKDLNDPTGPTYEVRWAVIPTVVTGQVVAKRYIVGVWKRDPNQVYPPVTVDGWKQK